MLWPHGPTMQATFHANNVVHHDTQARHVRGMSASRVHSLVDRLMRDLRGHCRTVFSVSGKS